MLIRERAVRVPVEGVSLRIAAASGHLVNISATGALMRATELLAPNLEYPIYLDVAANRVPLTGRVTRSHATEGADYLVAVNFTALPPSARVAVARLCGNAFTQRE